MDTQSTNKVSPAEGENDHAEVGRLSAQHVQILRDIEDINAHIATLRDQKKELQESLVITRQSVKVIAHKYLPK